LPAACKALIAYYQNTDSNFWVRNLNSNYSPNREVDIESILDDTYNFQLVTGIVPRNDNGLLDWSYTGPKNDKEWAWFFNRHYHLLDLFVAYQQEGNLEYVRSISDLVTDWVISSPSKKSPTVWAQWRGLEVAFRIFHWVPIFYNLQQVDAFTPVARILMLSSIIDHAYYLRNMHSWGANWICREMNSLATIALCWPEFKSSQQWFNYASQRLSYEINQQVYVDGVHKELASHYHYATLEDFQQFANLLEVSGNHVSPDIKSGLERMWNYLAYSMRPDGHGVVNGDSDRDYNRNSVNQAATVYQRPDWTYITSNGEVGNRPNFEPSVFFPWAGQVIMRSGWDKLAHWAFFDIGPLGIYYHVHYDKLHLSISAYGRDLLVDSGRFRYVRDKFWRYFRESAGHNVILIDGKGQKKDTKQLHKPIKDNCAIAPEFDFAKATYDKGFRNIKGKVAHKRAVVYIRGKYWLVIDHIHTSRPRTIEALWHFHPDCTVVIKGNEVGSIDTNMGNLKILPASDLSWEVKLVKGQESPIQGWWSRQYNHKTPNPTAIYSTQIKESTTFAWVLFPSLGVAPNVTVNQLPSPKGSVILSIKIPGEKEDKIAVRIIGDEVISIGENLKLDGDCGIIYAGEKPLIANGCITDEIGNIIVEHNRVCLDN
ncbi:MAG: alginate lyase family protein, partial [Cyanobacteriota bacterium]|nr:alginate lyase family protein [Cyanobacteriota bacterium]